MAGQRSKFTYPENTAPIDKYRNKSLGEQTFDTPVTERLHSTGSVLLNLLNSEPLPEPIFRRLQFGASRVLNEHAESGFSLAHYQTGKSTKIAVSKVVGGTGSNFTLGNEHNELDYGVGEVTMPDIDMEFYERENYTRERFRPKTLLEYLDIHFHPSPVSFSETDLKNHEMRYQNFIELNRQKDLTLKDTEFTCAEVVAIPNLKFDRLAQKWQLTQLTLFGFLTGRGKFLPYLKPNSLEEQIRGLKEAGIEHIVRGLDVKSLNL